MKIATLGEGIDVAAVAVKMKHQWSWCLGNDRVAAVKAEMIHHTDGRRDDVQ